MANNYARSIFRISVGALCAALTILTSCEKNDPVEKDTLTVSVSSVSIPAEGGRKPVTVKSSSDWSASCPEEWVEITVNGNGTGFYVAGEANPYEEVRHATVTVTNLSGMTQDIAVSQAGITPVLEVDKQSVVLDVDGTAVSLTVTSNVEFGAECSSDWLTVSVQDDKVIISAEPTALFEERVDTVSLVPTMSEFERLLTKVAVKQQAREYAVAVAGDGVEDGTALIDAQENEIVLSVVANSDWSASCEAEWIKVEPAEGKATGEAGAEVVLSVEANEIPQSRRAEVVLVCGTAESKVAIEQRGAGIYLDMDDAPVTSDDGGCEFVRSVKTNGTLSVEVSESWVSAEIVQDELKVTVQPNTGAAREAVITVVSSSEGGAKETVQVKISQMAFAVDLSAVETANCYVVNRAGTYKIKATVKGNGASTEMLEREKKEIAPNGAMLVWATDTTGCISNVSISGDYIYFQTDGTNGNALIAATLDEYSTVNPDEPPYRTILWSWHIWMTDFDIEEPVNQYEVGGTAYGLHSTFMGRNLGAMTSGESGKYEDILGSFGMQYQWGRKDPFPPAGEIRFKPEIEVMGNKEGTNLSTVTNKNSVVYFYNEDGSVRGSSATSLPVKAVSSTKRSENIAYAIEHPSTFITSGKSPYMWVTSAALADVPSPIDPEDPWGHLWGNPYDNVNHVGEKSIYDPCPAGWQVPAAGQWAFISGHGSDIFWWFAATCPWKYNHTEALEAYEAGKITCNTDKITAAGGSVQSRKDNCYVRMTTMKGGFHVYYTSHHIGNESKEYNWLFQEYESYADGPTMFLPAAGQRSYLGYNIRTGFGAQYHSSSPRSVSGTAAERVQSHGTLIDYQGHQTFTYNADYEQLAAARSVRCVKTEE